MNKSDLLSSLKSSTPIPYGTAESIGSNVRLKPFPFCLFKETSTVFAPEFVKAILTNRFKLKSSGTTEVGREQYQLK